MMDRDTLNRSLREAPIYSSYMAPPENYNSLQSSKPPYPDKFISTRSSSIFTSGIREALLSQTPIGTSSTDVRTLLERRGWLVESYVGSTGFLKLDSGMQNEPVGVSSLRGNLGDYGPVSISVFWGFDSNNRLIDIGVSRIFTELAE